MVSDKPGNAPLLLRSTLIYAPAILLTRLSALLLLAIATRLVDQTEFGLLTLVVTIGEMTDIAVTNWLRASRHSAGVCAGSRQKRLISHTPSRDGAPSVQSCG